MSNPVLTRFETTILKSVGADRTQVPVGNAVVEIFRQGATVSEESPFVIPAGSQRAISVWDSGEIRAGDLVQVGVGNAPSLAVSAAALTQLTVSNTSTVDIEVTPGARLLLLSRLPCLYTDPIGMSKFPGNALVADSAGRVEAYIDRPRFDYIIHDSEEVQFDAATTATVVDGTALTWTHTASGPNAAPLRNPC